MCQLLYRWMHPLFYLAILWFNLVLDVVLFLHQLHDANVSSCAGTKQHDLPGNPLWMSSHKPQPATGQILHLPDSSGSPPSAKSGSPTCPSPGVCSSVGTKPLRKRIKMNRNLQ